MRASGILMPIFSLPSPYGIGTLGKEAKDFIDFLKDAGQTYWQVLPIGPTGYGDSPYQSFSAFAGNPYFIDLRILTDEGLLEKKDYENLDFGQDDKAVDYGKLYNTRQKVLKIAFNNFLLKDIPHDYLSFIDNNAYWLDDYAMFMVIKQFVSVSLDVFPKELKMRQAKALNEIKEQYRDEIMFQKVMQYWFFKQLKSVKDYANKNGIKIIGDMPIYVSNDSADVWANTSEFLLDEELKSTEIAGVPPDAFSKEGQLWGNPIYDWKAQKTNNYAWWCKRLEHSFKCFDIIRIDHFRGFDEYYAVKNGATNAVKGEWKKGPGISLFKALKENCSKTDIIAEDLGFMTNSVIKLLEKTGYPGMSVLQFGFTPGEDSQYLPHNIKKNSVVYIGTHDNDTAIGWLESLDETSFEFCKNYLRLNEQEGYNWGMIKAALATAADTCILTMQDILGLSSEGRINTPSMPYGNWTWRIEGKCLNDWLSGIIFKTTKLYNR